MGPCEADTNLEELIPSHENPVVGSIHVGGNTYIIILCLVEPVFNRTNESYSKVVMNDNLEINVDR